VGEKKKKAPEKIWPCDYPDCKDPWQFVQMKKGDDGRPKPSKRRCKKHWTLP
jgi:hypothetical protein